VDREGRQWTVREAVVPYDRRSTPSLIFDCGDIVRRVRDFPRNWFECSSNELIDISIRR
jgi:hypothetical protein